MDERLVEETHRPFDLQQGSLMRIHLFSRSAQEHILLLVMHHIIADLWSLVVLLDELGVLYPAECAGEQVTLPPHELQYPDHVRRQARTLDGPRGRQLQAYWQEHLSGELPVLDLHTDQPRPAVQTYRGASQALTLDEELTENLKAVGRAHGATLYMTLLAAFQALLYRYTGQQDILVGSPTSGRNSAESARLVGYFVNPIVLRANVSSDLSFTGFLDQVRQTVLEAFAHQDYPFDLLVEQLRPVRDPSRSPIFQAMLALQQSPLSKTGKEIAPFVLGEAGACIEMGGISVESTALDRRAAQFDLALVAAEKADGLGISLQYNVDLFDAATIARMAAHFHCLLESIVANPEQRISDLTLLTEVERRQLLEGWNETEAYYPQDQCIHKLFEAQVERTPDRVAVVFPSTGSGHGEDQHLTYRELNCRANQLAHHLQAVGVGPEVLVGICVERSLEMVVGLLGVLKASGTYVPLDPAYPQDRLSFVLEDTRSSVVLTQRQLTERLPVQRSRLVCLDVDWQIIARAGEENPTDRATPENLAYVIYTSGSTGRPKGVAIQHNSAVALIHWARDVFGSELLAGTLASTSICFDLSIFEIFVPLSCGGMVILAETALHLSAMPTAEAVTLINTVPSTMRELLHVDGVPTSVRVVNLAGEPLQTQLVRQIYQQEMVQRVFDLYGPSEDTTYSTYALRSATGLATIGRPIANTQVYLLDAHLNPAPVGVPGELCIGGAGLARGYLFRPELTAERFIPNPFLSGEDERRSARLYRTGDFARYLPDGNIELLGRIDHQVKIRGYRIELGEIEMVLAQHPAVQETVVLTREDEPSDAGKQLVAYVVAKEGQALAVEKLRRFLWEKLPTYMVPSAFVTLEALPLMLNGKVDRRALPIPGRARKSEHIFVAPRTASEKILADIWVKVLDLEQVGIHDDFFDLGGHSLLATRIISRVRDAFQVDLSLRAFFEAPTVASLAERVEKNHRSGQKPSMPPIVPIAQDSGLPVVFSQQRLWFLDQLESGSSTGGSPVAVRLIGQLSVTALEQSLVKLAEHQVLVPFEEVNGHPIQTAILAPDNSLLVLNLQGLSEVEQEARMQQLVTEGVQRPLDLARDRLVQGVLLQVADETHILLMFIRRDTWDGWSIDALIRELAVFYQARVMA
ncbi:MAG: amino acid adenylation domain-containing protein [Chloroflexi bacterium]|nr:amino acid adenylation domain-containing protein [Chloroflexota bacterium]